MPRPLPHNQVVESCGSTNDLARELGEAGYPHGTWISARFQENGRGRMGRKWETQDGNLFLSLVARIEERSLWTWIPLTAAAACADFLRAQFAIDVALKWPNDLLIGSAKLGGVLCEAVSSGSSSFVVVGIGLNCRDAPHGLDQPATSLTERHSGGIITADGVRVPIAQAIARELQALASHGSSRTRERYGLWAALPAGTQVEWGASRGRVEGLGENAELLVRDDRGEVRKIFADDVTKARRAGGGSPA